jgi:hypothetical protein
MIGFKCQLYRFGPGFDTPLVDMRASQIVVGLEPGLQQDVQFHNPHIFGVHCILLVGLLTTIFAQTA